MSKDITAAVLLERNASLRHGLDIMRRENKLLRELIATYRVVLARRPSPKLMRVVR